MRPRLSNTHRPHTHRPAPTWRRPQPRQHDRTDHCRSRRQAAQLRKPPPGKLPRQPSRISLPGGRDLSAGRQGRAAGQHLLLQLFRRRRPITSSSRHLPVQRWPRFGVFVAAYGRVRSPADHRSERRHAGRQRPVRGRRQRPVQPRRQRPRVHRPARHRLQPHARRSQAGGRLGGRCRCGTGGRLHQGLADRASALGVAALSVRRKLRHHARRRGGRQAGRTGCRGWRSTASR